MNEREMRQRFTNPTWYISVQDIGRVPIRCQTSDQAYQIACNLYGKDKVVNDARFEDYGF